jgi:phosphomevalonate kinase
MVAARVFALRGTDLEIATASDLDPGATKTGLGGSAAVTAATVSAVQRIACPAESPMESTRTRVATALYAHRLAQGGGSGADVVASSAGGPVGAAAARARIAELRWAQLELPATLALDVVATGRSCATGPRVARYRAAFAGPQGRVLRAWAGGMRAATEIFRDGCRTHDAATVLRATRLAGRLLSRLGAIAGLRVYTPELRRACVLAAAQPGCAGKPSGAGGGDCAIAIVTREQRPALRGRWSESGLFPLDVDLEPRGAACEVVA